jgi:hypothetical protein
MARRGKVERLYARPDPEIRDAIEQLDSGRNALRNDVLPVEAALNADGVIVSTDDQARALFADLSHRVERLQPIVWVNPERETGGTASVA